MNTNHTPGPWCITTCEAKRIHYIDAFSSKGRLSVGECRTTKNALANARLIAAAPLLLDALKDAEQRMRSYLSLLKCDDEFIAHETAMVRTAIAAATN